MNFGDDPTVAATVFLGLVCGSVAAGGIKPPDLTLFSLILGTLIVFRYVGGILGNVSETVSARFISGSIDQLKKGPRAALAGKVDTEKLAILEAMAVCVVGVGLWSAFLAKTEDALASVVVLAAAAALLAIRLARPAKPSAVIVLALLVTVAPCLLAVLGVFVQAPPLRAEGLLLGLVPGSMLAAGIVAQLATVFEKHGWRRAKVVTTKSGEQKSRPLGLARLYTAFLMSGFFVVFVLASLALIPRPFMLLVLAMFVAPKVATAFLLHTGTDSEVYRATVRLALLTGVLTLIASATARVMH